MKKYSQFNRYYRDTYLIGVAGHVDPEGKDQLSLEVKRILEEIKQKGHRKLALLCPGAKGADQLAAAVAMELDIPVIGLRLLHLREDAGHPPELLRVFEPNRTWMDDMQSNPGFNVLDLDDGAYAARLQRIKSARDATLREAWVKDLEQALHIDASAVIAGYSDYIITLWDGLDNGKRGGTSETVHMALHGSDFKGMPIWISKPKKKTFEPLVRKMLWARLDRPKGMLYQVVTPRRSNPFAIGRFPAQLFKAVPFVNSYETGITPFPLKASRGNWLQKLRVARRKGVWKTNNLLNYWVPVVLALSVVILGTLGFEEMAKSMSGKPGAQTELMSWPNYVFNAVNLLTLNSSASIHAETSIISLEIARWLGLVFLLYAFFIGILISIGKNNKVRFKIWVWRQRRKEYHLIAGLNDMSHHLALDIQHHGKRVLIIHPQADDSRIKELETKGVSVFIGSVASSAVLGQVKALQAKNVYFLDDDDTLNLRALHELDQLVSPKQKQADSISAHKKQRYVHLKDARYRDFVCKSHPDTPETETHVFNIYENTARRLLISYPIYRFDLSKESQNAEVFIFGFTEMGQEILLNCLRTGIFEQHRNLKITVFTRDHKTKRDDFFERFPALSFEPTNLAYERPFAKAIRAEIFPEGMLTFKELPLSDAAFFAEESIHHAIRNDAVVSLYFCTPQSLQSAAYLNAILPKIRHLQAAEGSGASCRRVQCFCHYNLFDRDEVRYVEHMLNAQIPAAPVICFGSFANECTEAALAERAEDVMPKLINIWYELGVDSFALNMEEGDAQRAWKSLSVAEKESNRYAADHLWVKLYLMRTSFFKLLQEFRKGNFEQVAASFAYRNSSERQMVLEMAKMEHRRWCAQLLLDGFLPLQDFEPALFQETVLKDTLVKWNTGGLGFKKHYREQKQHLDLVPYHQLQSFDMEDRRVDEKLKDISIIEAIPYLIRKTI